MYQGYSGGLSHDQKAISKPCQGALSFIGRSKGQLSQEFSVSGLICHVVWPVVLAVVVVALVACLLFPADVAVVWLVKSPLHVMDAPV